MEGYLPGRHAGLMAGIRRRMRKGNQMTMTPDMLAETYFRAWRDREFDLFSEVLAPDVHFVGPMAEFQGREAAITGLQGLRSTLEDIRVIHRFTDDDNVVTWFELIVAGIDPIPVANWSRIREGQIAEIRVTFDPRPLISHMANPGDATSGRRGFRS
jgi:hypothetical protein